MKLSDLSGNLLAFSFVNIKSAVSCTFCLYPVCLYKGNRGEEEKFLSKMTEIMIPTQTTGQCLKEK